MAELLRGFGPGLNRHGQILAFEERLPQRIGGGRDLALVRLFRIGRSRRQGGGWIAVVARTSSGAMTTGGAARSTSRRPSPTGGSKKRGVSSSTTPKKRRAASAGKGSVNLEAAMASWCFLTRS